MYSCGPLHIDKQRQDDQLEPTSSSSVPILDVALRTCREQWTIGRGGEKGSGISVLIAQHDDDNDGNSNETVDSAEKYTSHQLIATSACVAETLNPIDCSVRPRISVDSFYRLFRSINHKGRERGLFWEHKYGSRKDDDRWYSNRIGSFNQRVINRRIAFTVSQSFYSRGGSVKERAYWKQKIFLK